MSTQSTTGADVIIVAADTLISSSSTESRVKFKLPAIADMTDGDEIRLECTGGGFAIVETEDGKQVGIVPGRGQAVVVAESGSGDADFWRFKVLAGPSAAFQSITATYVQAEIVAIRDCLRDHGLMKAE